MDTNFPAPEKFYRSSDRKLIRQATTSFILISLIAVIGIGIFVAQNTRSGQNQVLGSETSSSPTPTPKPTAVPLPTPIGYQAPPTTAPSPTPIITPFPTLRIDTATDSPVISP